MTVSSLDNSEFITYQYYYAATTTKRAFKCEMEFNPQTLSFENSNTFTILVNDVYSDENAQKLANLAMKVYFAGWNYLLYDEVSLNLSDIGFTSYQ